jgi:hypothetical protein
MKTHKKTKAKIQKKNKNLITKSDTIVLKWKCSKCLSNGEVLIDKILFFNGEAVSECLSCGLVLSQINGEIYTTFDLEI